MYSMDDKSLVKDTSRFTTLELEKELKIPSQDRCYSVKLY